ncbi:retroelement silencing factor 1 isoform X1 [Pyxicephalus adspersus]|uniref:retroelement silencing factor 1 isoform X1 n=1 Tax=Pyxicephalus adspersus TaxID=30357 RepID=UPI003B5A38DD
MEWNSNGAIAPPQSQQYLLSSTTSMAANGASQSSSIQQNAIGQHESYNSSKVQLLQHLLRAKSNEDVLKVQHAALGHFRGVKQKCLPNQMKSSLHISSYKPTQEAAPITDNRSAIAGQMTVGSNYRMPTHVNTVRQTPQHQQSVAIGQPFGNGYNASMVQQPPQNSQAFQTCTYPQQNNLYASTRPPANSGQIPCQQMIPNVPSSPMYNLRNGVSGQLMSSQKLPSETNVSAPMQDCRNSQNSSSSSLANYRQMAPNIFPQQMSVSQIPTSPQLDGNAICYTQSQQIQNLQNALVKNSQGLSAAPAKMLPTYAQAMTNPPNTYIASVNQNFNKQRENYIASNVQQPAQTANAPPPQSSVGDEQSQVREIINTQERKRDMLKLFMVYRNVRQKYELLNRENNLLRQRLKATMSQENAGPPPLLSSLTGQPQTNCVMAAQQNLNQAIPVQNSAQINSSRGFQGQNVYDNVVNSPAQASIQHCRSVQDNAAVLNQMYKSGNENHLRENNYSVFDGGQADIANESTIALQLLSSENLPTKVHQEVTSRDFRGKTPNNQYASSSNNIAQNGPGLQSPDKPISQSLKPSCPEKNGYETLHPYAARLTGNGQTASVSREAIEASLPLWKTLAQSSQSTNGSPESQQSQSLLESPHAAFKLLDEPTVGLTNDVSSTNSVQKQDSAISNQANLQIAIVSPLVQSKEGVHEDFQMPKFHLQSTDLENTTTTGLVNVHENDCFDKILQVLESLEADSMNNKDPSRSKKPPVASQDNANLSLPSSTEVLSQTIVDGYSEDVEIVDDSLQISGICTLVEGNSFYDSSIAMMFDATSDTTALPISDTRDDHSKTVDISKSAYRTSPIPDTAIKPEPVDDHDEVAVGHMMENDSTDMQVDQHKVSDQQGSWCDMESSSISDQLSELLTEFPYGIKNYMSENTLENTKGPSEMPSDKPLSAACENSVYEGKVFRDTQSKMVPSPSNTLQHNIEGVSDPLMDLRSSAERLPAEVQQSTEFVPCKDVVGFNPSTDSCLDDDGFETLSISPVSDLHITVLDQDDIPKIFPDADDHVGTEKCNGTNLEGVQKCATTEEFDRRSPSPVPTDMTETGTDKNLFCCLFSWLTHTNGNAPKCNCKQVESLKEIELTNLVKNDSDSVSILKADPSPQSPEATLGDLHKPNIGAPEILEPIDRPPKLEPEDSNYEEIFQPMEKPPKLERINPEAECVKKSFHDFSSQEGSINSSTSVEGFLSINDDMKKNNPESHLKSLTPSPKKVEPTFKKQKHQSPHKKFKSQSSRKSEKLIVKTDFLKTKLLIKEKIKDKVKNGANVAEWFINKSSPQSELSQNLPGEPVKRPQGEETVAQNIGTASVEQSPDQQAERSWNRQKSSGVDKSLGLSQGVKRRKKRESHFEKTRKVPTVQEYLERKREFCKKRSEVRTEPGVGLEDIKHPADRPEIGSNNHLNLNRPLSPVKSNVSSNENKHDKTPKTFYRKDLLQSGKTYESGHRKHKDSHNGQRVPGNKTQNRVSSKDKIYLSPCVGSRCASYEGINLAKLQIRHSPEKTNHVDRRRSLDGSRSTLNQSSAVKKHESPKMLEFKLCPEFVHGSPTTQDKVGETTDSKRKSSVEGM